MESFTSARLAVFLALAHTRITGEQAVGLECRTQIGVGNQERPRNAVPDGAGLAGRPPSAHADAYVGPLANARGTARLDRGVRG